MDFIESIVERSVLKILFPRPSDRADVFIRRRRFFITENNRHSNRVQTVIVWAPLYYNDVARVPQTRSQKKI